MSRRQTLAPIDPNVSRASFGPRQKSRRLTQIPTGRRSMSRRSSFASAKRMSMAPSSRDSAPQQRRQSRVGGGRRSSMYGEQVVNKFSDPRPISNREYQRDCKMTLIKYLSERNYGHTLSMSILKQPTGKDFANIFKFLVHQLHPNYHFGSAKGGFEAEVASLLKRLHYPFQVNKSVIQSPGSPHSWPVLLAMLVWMVELLERLEMMDTHNDMDEGERLFFDYIVRAYDDFLSGGDPMPELDDELAANMESKTEMLTSEVTTLQAELAETKQVLDGLNNEEAPAVVLERRYQEASEDVGKFEVYIAKLHKHKSDMEATLEAHVNDAAAREADLAAVLSEKESLQSRINSQELSAADVERMNLEAARLENEINAIGEQKAAAAQTKWEAEVSISKNLNAVEKMAAEYTAILDSLGLAEGSKNTCLVECTASVADMAVAVNPHGSCAEEFISVDAALARAGLLQVKTSLANQVLEAQVGLLEAKEAAERAAEAATERADEVRALEARLRSTEIETTAAKANAADALAAKEADIAAVEAEVLALKNSGPDDVDAAQQRLARVQTQYAELQAKVAADEQTFKESVVHTVEILTTHKEYIETQLAAEQARARADAAAISARPIDA